MSQVCVHAWAPDFIKSLAVVLCDVHLAESLGLLAYSDISMYFVQKIV